MKPTDPRHIQSDANRQFRILADLLGVRLSGDFKQDRAAVDRALAGGSTGSGLALGEHPAGRPSTLDEIVTRYRDGELSDEYEPPAADAPPTREWFDEEGEASYGRPGFHVSGHSYEHSKLWYQLFGEELSLIGQEMWAIEHGGLRWEYHGEGSPDRGELEGAATRAYARYLEAAEAILSGYEPASDSAPDPAEDEPPAPDFTTDELLALLAED